MTGSSNGRGKRPADGAGPSPASPPSADARLARVFDEFAAVVQTGDETAIGQYLRRHGEFASELVDLLPTIRAVAAVRADESTPADAGEPAVSRGPRTVADAETRTLGDFRLLREVGRGGMGVVYEAQQISMGRTVALKVLPFAAMMDPRQVQRFRNEVQAASLLQHQNIVPVYSVGCERGVNYYAMQFVAGWTLAELIADLRAQASPRDRHPVEASDDDAHSRGATALQNAFLRSQAGNSYPTVEAVAAGCVAAGTSRSAASVDTSALCALSTHRSSDRGSWFRAAAQLMTQAADALQHAHDRGVVHRDVKPGNIMVDGTGNLWITDFGLARLNVDANITMSGDVLGTLRYMSPEQAQGSNAIVDQRTDVYSLGATMYELLALRPAFEGAERGPLLRRILEEAPPRLRDHEAAIPRELETIVNKAMEKSPADRYASAQAMADDLRRFLEHRPLLARPPSVVERMRKWSLRHVGVVWTALTALLALVAVLVIAVLFIAASRSELKRQRELAIHEGESARAAERAIGEALREAKAAQARSEALLYAADVRLAADGLQNDTVGRGVERLTRHIPRPGQQDRRGFAWHYLWRKLHPEQDTWDAGEGLFCLRYSPRGDVLVTGGESGTVTLWNASTGRPARRFHTQHQIIRDLAFSDAGDLLAAASDDGSVVVWDVEGGTLIARTSLPPTQGMCVCFSRDGQTLFTASERYVRAWRHPWEEPVVTIGPHPGDIYAISLSPNGAQLAVASDGPKYGWVTLWDDVASTDAPRRVTEPGRTLHSRGKCVSVAFSHDGKYVTAGTVRGGLLIWETGGADEPVTSVDAHTGNIYDIAVADDGRHVATASKDGKVCVFDDNWDCVATLQSHSGRVYGIDFKPGTTQLASAGGDGAVKTWNPREDCFSLRRISGFLAYQTVPSQRDGRVALAHKEVLASGDPTTSQLERIVRLPGTEDACWYGDDSLVLAWSTPPDFTWQRGGSPSTPRVRRLDLDADGDQDLVAAFGDEYRVVWQNNRGDEFDAPQLRSAAMREARIHVDLNKDGSPETVLRRYNHGEVHVGNPSQITLRDKGPVLTVSTPACVETADLDEDGLQDLLCASHAPGRIVCWMQRPAPDGTSFTPHARTLLELPGASAVKALNMGSHNGRLIVAASESAKQIVVLRWAGTSGQMAFEEVQRLSTAPIRPLAIEYRDADGDALHDLLVAGPEGVRYFRLNGPTFEENSRPLPSLEATWARPLAPDVGIVDAATTAVKSQFWAAEPNYVAASIRSQRVATAGDDDVIRVWDLEGRQLAAVGGQQVWKLHFCREGNRLFAAVGDDVIAFDVENLEVLWRSTEHQNTVNSLAVSHGNDVVASTSRDLTAKLWSVETGELMHNLTGHTASIESVGFSLDDRLVATGDYSGVVKILGRPDRTTVAGTTRLSAARSSSIGFPVGNRTNGLECLPRGKVASRSGDKVAISSLNRSRYSPSIGGSSPTTHWKFLITASAEPQIAP